MSRQKRKADDTDKLSLAHLSKRVKHDDDIDTDTDTEMDDEKGENIQTHSNIIAKLPNVLLQSIGKFLTIPEIHKRLPMLSTEFRTKRKSSNDNDNNNNQQKPIIPLLESQVQYMCVHGNTNIVDLRTTYFKSKWRPMLSLTLYTDQKHFARCILYIICKVLPALTLLELHFVYSGTGSQSIYDDNIVELKNTIQRLEVIYKNKNGYQQKPGDNWLFSVFDDLCHHYKGHPFRKLESIGLHNISQNSQNKPDQLLFGSLMDLLTTLCSKVKHITCDSIVKDSKKSNILSMRILGNSVPSARILYDVPLIRYLHFDISPSLQQQTDRSKWLEYVYKCDEGRTKLIALTLGSHISDTLFPIFPLKCLKYLHLKNTPSVGNIWNRSFWFECPHLEVLKFNIHKLPDSENQRDWIPDFNTITQKQRNAFTPSLKYLEISFGESNTDWNERKEGTSLVRFRDIILAFISIMDHAPMLQTICFSDIAFHFTTQSVHVQRRQELLKEQRLEQELILLGMLHKFNGTKYTQNCQLFFDKKKQDPNEPLPRKKNTEQMKMNLMLFARNSPYYDPLRTKPINFELEVSAPWLIAHDCSMWNPGFCTPKEEVKEVKDEEPQNKNKSGKKKSTKKKQQQ